MRGDPLLLLHELGEKVRRYHLNFMYARAYRESNTLALPLDLMYARAYRESNTLANYTYAHAHANTEHI